MEKSFTVPIAEADLAFAAEKTAKKIQAFVAGPEISLDWDEEKWLEVQASSRLRRSIKDYIESVGHHVILGEHRGVQEMADGTISSSPSVVVTETYLAAKRCDCVIIIPDSPGSFCELGAWSSKDDIASKMLILANKAFEPMRSYLNPGVFGLATHLGAQLSWIDYDNFDPKNDGVGLFISNIHDRAFIKAVMHG